MNYALIILNVRANRPLSITYIINNDATKNIATLLLNTYQKALKKNVDKKFMNSIYFKSNISIFNK